MSPSPRSGRHRFATAALTALLSLSLAACSGSGSASTASVPAKAPPTASRQDVPAVTTPNVPKKSAQPPTPSSILYLIYQKDGDGALSYEVNDHAVATYWYGYEFDAAGKHWYTGFAYNSPEIYGPVDDNHIPAPATPVNITEVTLYKESAASEKDWTIDGSSPTIGEFGAYERGGEIDTARKPERQDASENRFVLAIPTKFFADGVDSYEYEVFLFDPADLDLDVNYGRKRWTYVGNIHAGSDNGASCGNEAGNTPCVKHKGTLSFGPAGADGLPTIRIAMSGAEAAQGNTEYRYDAAKKQYVAQP